MDDAELKNTRAASFDNIADIYEKVRPGYSDEVYNLVEKYTSLSPDSKILEIGAGDGKATSEMNNRWHSQFTVNVYEPDIRNIQRKKTDERRKELEESQCFKLISHQEFRT